MFVVALVALGGPLEDEIPALAVDLALTAYEAGLFLRAGLPAIALRTDDRERALGLLARLRARGHDAVACDAEAVVASETMHAPRTFRLEPDALVSLGPTGSNDTLPFADLFAILRANHQTRTEAVAQGQKRTLSLSRSALSGGLINTKTVTTETIRTTDAREPVAYLVRQSGPPWLLSATRVRYDGLGDAVKPGQLENFELLLRRLREGAPHAVYDDRLLSVRGASTEKLRTSGTGQHVVTSATGVDLLAHVLALAIARRARGV